MKTLAALMPTRTMLQHARDEMNTLMARNDIPLELIDKIPADLHDTITDFLGGLPGGGQITGRLAPRDLLGLGWPSPVEPLLMLGLVALMALQGAFGGIPGIGWMATGLATFGMLGILALLYQTLPLRRFSATVVACIALPALGLQPGGGVLGLVNAMDRGVPGAALMVPALLLLGLIFIGGDTGHTFKEMIARAVKILLGALLLLVAGLWLSRTIPMLAPLSYFGVACGFPIWVARGLEREHAVYLAVQAHFANLETRNGILKANKEARIQQIHDAIADPTPLIEIGTARGVLQRKRDTYAPDAGLPFRASMRDLGNSLLITGVSGSGKTVLIRNLLCQALQHAVGLVILCGKAELPLEFAGLRDYTIIQPGKDIPLGLIEGLSPEQVVQTFFGNATPQASTSDSSGSSAFFQNAGYEMGIHAAVLLEALIAAERCELKTLHEGSADYAEAWVDQQRQFRWTVVDLQRLMDEAIAAGRADKGSEAATLFEAYVHKIKTYLDPSERSTLLESALDYFIRSLPNLDERTLSNIQFTVRGWFQPLTLHRDLIGWAETEHGIDVCTPLRGGRIGVALPRNKYGLAARLVQSLIKLRIETAVLQRGNNPVWRSDHEGTALHPQTPVVMVLDEAQDLIDSNDGEYIRKCRAFGGITIFGTQSIENIYESMGQHGADAFLSNCNNRITLRATAATNEWFVKELGTALVLKWKSAVAGMGYIPTLESVATSPILDPSHPQRNYYKQMLRRGALRIALFPTQAPNQLGGDKLGHHRHGFDLAHPGLEIQATTQSEMIEEQLLTVGEVQRYTAERGVAVASINRAGVPRRDVIKIPMLDPKVVLADQWTTP